MIPMQGARTVQAAILTALTMAFLTALGFTLGTEAVILAAVTLPVPLLLLWLSADVRRADESQHVEARVRPLHDAGRATGRGALLSH